MRAAGVLAIAAIVLAGRASAQWIHLPLPGTPRTPDGKPNLSAPAPRTPDGRPDLSGVWQYVPPLARQATAGNSSATARGGGARGLARLLQKGDAIVPQPWAEELYKKRRENNSAGLPSEHCLPHGPPEGWMIPIPFKILQTGGEIAVLFEEFNYFRQIFTDGRGHPPSLNPTWYGYSIGNWDRDTLVVNTVGYNDRTWLDISGYPHSEDLHTIERITRPDFGHMSIVMTIDDPKAYKQPFSLLLDFELQPDTELIEEVCENERDARHMVGK
jgi:hypothetical protein